MWQDNRTLEDFRAEVDAFLDREWKPLVQGASGGHVGEPEKKAFRRKAIDAGYLFDFISRDYGGGGAEMPAQAAAVVRDAFAAVGAPLMPAGIAPWIVVPVLNDFGTEAQKRKYLPATIEGDMIWSQGFSEPGAGSDLVSLRTGAEFRDGKWIVNGQKVWSTFAHLAHRMILLARTDPQAKAHAGLSFFLIDLHQPGVTVRPLTQMNGRQEFCEVFFENAVVEADDLLGKPGQGWEIAGATLGYERRFIANPMRTSMMFGRVLDIVRESSIDGQPAIKDPRIRDRLAQVKGKVEAITRSALREAEFSAAGKDAGTFVHMRKLLQTTVEQEMTLIVRDVLGNRLLTMPPGDEDDTRWTNEEFWNNFFMRSLAIAIAGGTSNIQRNIIANRGYGLPR